MTVNTDSAVNTHSAVIFHGVAYAELHVEDATKSAARLVDGHGFEIDHTSPHANPPAALGLDRIALREGGVRLVLTSAADPDHPVAGFVRRHGDGVAVIAMLCDDAPAAFAHAVSHGAEISSAADLSVTGFGDVALRFVQPEDGGAATGEPIPGLFEVIDHAAICVPSGEMAATASFCERVLGFRRIFGEHIEIGSQGMDSIVVQSASGAVTFTLLEPDSQRQPGQIDAFLASHAGVGVQHLAFRTADIAGTIRELTERGVSFLTTPPSYFDLLEERLGRTEIPLDTLRELNILVDQDHGGQLFQIFTRSSHARRTFFFELIERRGASTFGTANIKALYEAVERQNA